MVHHSLAVLLAGLGALVPPLSAQDDRPGRKISGPIALLHEFQNPLVECVVSENGAWCAVYTRDHMLHFMKIADHLGKDVKSIGKNDSVFRYEMTRLMFSPDGERLIGRIDHSTLAVVTRKPKILHHFRGLPGVISASLHKDGVTLAAGMKGGLVRTWDSTTGKPLRYLRIQDENLLWIGFTRDGTSLITATADKKLHFFTFPAIEQRSEAQLEAPLQDAMFTVDGKILVTAAGTKVKRWSLVGAAVANGFDVKKQIVKVAVSADGKVIAVAHQDGGAALHDAKSGKRSAAWQPHRGKTIVCLRFIEPIAGRHFLVTAARGDDVVYWDLAKVGPGAGKHQKARRKAPRQKRE